VGLFERERESERELRGDTDVEDDVFPPGVGLDRFGGPFGDGTGGVFVARVLV
jgi:hypothetical protein